MEESDCRMESSVKKNKKYIIIPVVKIVVHYKHFDKIFTVTSMTRIKQDQANIWISDFVILIFTLARKPMGPGPLREQSNLPMFAR